MSFQKKIALVDCNNFFVSCERVFKPHLEKVPVAVLSGNNGCFIARSQEIKNLGIPMAAPYFKYKKICDMNNAKLFTTNFPLYGDISRRVMEELKDFSSHREIYSIDEAFLDLSHIHDSDLETMALLIKAQIEKNIGIPVTVGIGPSKVLAKAAAHFGKKTESGVFSLQTPEKIEEGLEKLSCQDIWGIGSKSAQKLSSYGVKTALQLAQAQPTLIKKILTIVGSKVQKELNGESVLDIDLDMINQKQILRSRSFISPVTSLEDLKVSISRHITHATTKLRSQDSITWGLKVFIRTSAYGNNPHYGNSHIATLSAGTLSTPKLISKSFKLLEEIYKPGFLYKKSGICLFKLQNQDSYQLDLFEKKDSNQSKILMKTMDDINKKFGTHTLSPASNHLKKAIGPKRLHSLSIEKSKCFTTRWDHLLSIG